MFECGAPGNPVTRSFPITATLAHHLATGGGAAWHVREELLRSNSEVNRKALLSGEFRKFVAL
jgi:hypothetical protein